MTVAEILSLQGFPIDGGPYHAIVLVDGEPLSEADMLTVRPVAGQRLVANIVPHGGDGKGFLGILMGILMVVASAFTFGAGGALVPIALGEISVAGWAGIAGGLLSIGSSIYSMAAPGPTVPFSGDIPTAQKSHSIQGTRNSLRPYEPIPTVYGRYRMYPPYLAKPFTEVVGNDTYLRLLFTFGYGPLDISELKIGETSFEGYGLTSGQDYILHSGYDDDAGLTIFTDDIDEENFNITLEDDDASAGSFPMVPGEWQTITTALGSKEVSVDLVFPGGLIAITEKKGTPVKVLVYFRIEYQPKAEASGWVEAIVTNNDAETGIHYIGSPDSSGPSANSNYRIKLKERGRITRGIRFDVDGADNGQYDIRIRRTATMIEGVPRTSGSAPPEKNQQHDMAWTAIRSIRPYTGTTLVGISKLEMRIRATDRLSGMLDSVNALCESILPKHRVQEGWGTGGRNSADYNVNIFPTRNPAWIFADILRGRQNSSPVADDQIDADAIREWATDCGQSGVLGGFSDTGDGQERHFDAVVDFPVTVRKLLDDVAGSSRASFNIVDAMYSVVVDKKRTGTPITQHFTPRNSSNFSGSKSFRKKPQGVRVNYINPDSGYQPEELLVHNDGFSVEGNEAYGWEFNGTDDGWSGLNSTITAKGNYLELNETVASGSIDSPASLDLDGSKFNKVRLSVRRSALGSGAAWDGRLRWSTTSTGEGSTFNNTREVNFPEPKWDQGISGFVDVTIDLAGEINWISKTINEIRLNFYSLQTGSVLDINRIAIDDGTQPAKEYSSIDLWGITDPIQAYRDARYHIASTILRPESYSLDTDIEYLACTRGDLVRVTHDSMAVGLGGARFASVTNAGGEFVSGTLDSSFVFDGAKAYAIHIRQDDGNEIYVPLNNPGAETTLVEATDPVAYTGSAPQVGDLVLFGEAGINSDVFIVNGISPRQDLAATLHLINYNDAVYEPGPIPAFQSNTSLPSLPINLEPSIPVIDSMVSDESALVFTGGAPSPRLLISCHVKDVSTVSVTHIAANYRIVEEDLTPLSGWYPVPIVEHVGGTTQLSIAGVETGDYYQVRIRSISQENNIASGWATSGAHLILGGNELPPDIDPDSLTMRGDSHLLWLYPNPPVDFKGFRVKYQSGTDSTWDTGLAAHDGLVADNDFPMRGVIPYGSATVMVKAVDFFGNESANAASLTVNITAIGIDNLVWQSFGHWHPVFGYWPLAYNGGSGTSSIQQVTLTDCSVDIDNFVKADSAGSLFWGGPSGSFWAGDGDDFWDVIYKEMSVTFQAKQVKNTHLPCRVTSEFETEGDSENIEWANATALTDFTNNVYEFGPFQKWPGEISKNTIFFGSSTLYWDVYLFKVTIAGGRNRGIFKTATIKTDKVTIDEHFSGESIATASSGVRLLPTKSFNTVTSVQITLRDGDDAAIAKVSDLQSASGPLVKVYEADGTTTTTATFDAVIRGY